MCQCTENAAARAQIEPQNGVLINRSPVATQYVLAVPVWAPHFGHELPLQWGGEETASLHRKCFIGECLNGRNKIYVKDFNSTLVFQIVKKIGIYDKRLPVFYVSLVMRVTNFIYLVNG